MTVKELKEMLEQYDDNLVVCFDDYEYGAYELNTVYKKENYEGFDECVLLNTM